MPYIPRQYDSAKVFLNKAPKFLGNITDPMDRNRLVAYELYDDFYYNRPETFEVSLRGDSDIEIYVPSTKKIVDSTARFLAVDQDFQVKGGDQSAVDTLLRNIFAREAVSRKQVKGKKSLLTRGDLVWYITADHSKRAGDRISINTIHPSCVFPIEDPENAFRVIGYHIVDLVRDPRDPDKVVARRQTYRREHGGVSSEVRTFELGGWDDRNLKPGELKPVSIVMPKQMLPQPISQLPVYFISNNEPDGSTYGLSQLSGMEYLVNAMNQSMTYEDLSLVLQGLGVYVTSAAPPPGESGQPGKYKLHPGNVVEIGQEDEFKRVTGVASVAPFREHVGAMDTWLLQGTGLPDMATGIVADVAVAQSGIALALKMGPIIAENSDKQLAIGAIWDQFGYDLIHGWLPAIEGIYSEATEFKTLFGDPMPLNRDAYIKETIDLFTTGVILIEEVRERLEKIGYQKISQIEDKLLEQKSKWAIAETGDPFAGEAAVSVIDEEVSGAQ